MQNTPAWQTLFTLQQRIQPLHLKSFFADNPNRYMDFSLETCGILLDYSKNKITNEVLNGLCDLAISCEVPQKVKAFFAGAEVNITEQRAALHPLLRSTGEPLSIDNKNNALLITDALQKCENFVTQVHTGKWRGFQGHPITDIVNIGVGGSYLGAKVLCDALKTFDIASLQFHFINSIDSTALHTLMHALNPLSTLFIVSSKSFTTQETLLAAKILRDWINVSAGNPIAFKQHMVAISANEKAVNEFGIGEEQFFPLWEWVGGRYSVWSAIALPAMLQVGMDQFRNFLSGGEAMDKHFCTAPLKNNMPVLLALIDIWNNNFLALENHLIIPYDQPLTELTAYIQQLEMESNGKAITHTNQPVTYATAPMIWGANGCHAQHSFQQLLHQGTRDFYIDFIVCAKGQYEFGQQHAWILANCLSQSMALMNGYSDSEFPFKNIPGDHPNNVIILNQLTPNTLGSLIALYEHKVFVEAAIWNINPFDQWGVELAKRSSQAIFTELTSGTNCQLFDSSTRGLIAHLKTLRKISD